MDTLTYQEIDDAELEQSLLDECYGFDFEADASGITGEPVEIYSAANLPTRGLSGPGFAKASDVVHRTFGTLYTTPYTSASGHYYPGRYYTVPGRQIRRVIIHQIANGDSNITCETLNAVALRRTGSWTYTVMSDGEIVQWLPESVAPWTTSSYAADKDAITIEVENCGGASAGWPISGKAMASLCLLLADIALRYPDTIGRYYFDGTKDGSNVHRHEWYANTDCPGRYIKEHTAEIIKAANSLIDQAHADDVPVDFSGVRKIGDSWYLYLDGKRQSKPGEYCDSSGNWYHVGQDGKAAVSKDVRLPYTFAGEDPEQEKWCRYDENGHMVKGWDVDQDGQIYLFDRITGKMAKGTVDGYLQATEAGMLPVVLDFDRTTGKLRTVNAAPKEEA
jgi:hypothetical protein